MSLAHDLIVWTQTLCLDGELAKAEPERLRYRLLLVAEPGVLCPRAKLHVRDSWPWAADLAPPSKRFNPYQPALADRRSSRHPADSSAPPP